MIPHLEISTMTIKLKEMVHIADPSRYKLHLASWNDEDQPLHVFVRDKEEWKGWNSWRGTTDRFSREYIFSLIHFYHEIDTWLFGGIFKVLSRSSDRYEVELDPQMQELIGRLKITLKRTARAQAVYLEKHYNNMVVSEILKNPYTGEVFPGYEDINHGFRHLEVIYRNEQRDWKAALENVKGIYLITDTSNGKRYVGSAYGDSGIWSRWACYIETGHGWSDELTKLIKRKGIDYARRNFTFALLEYRSMKTDDKIIIERESYWKEVLLTRGEFGYNKN